MYWPRIQGTVFSGEANRVAIEIRWTPPLNQHFAGDARWPIWNNHRHRRTLPAKLIDARSAGGSATAINPPE